MPRVTYTTYRNRHLILRQLWAEHEGVFSRIKPGEQWALHSYYLCAVKMTEHTLRNHYLRIRDMRSSLPHRAGKAYARLKRSVTPPAVRLTRPVSNMTIRKRAGKIVVQPLVRPQPDVDRLAKVLIRMARESLRQDAAINPAADDPTDSAA